MLWIDKHCPRRLNDLSCHAHLTPLLKKLAVNGDIPHLLFYGPAGSGKKTRILALLREIFGTAIDKIKAETFVHKESNTEVVMTQSANHLQLSCPDLGSKDRVVVQQVIKELSSTAGASSFFTSAALYRVFIFQEAEALCEGAQAGLRRTLEKYVRFARVFLHVQQLSCIMLPLRSRCLLIRVPRPSEDEVLSVLRNICTLENISPIQASDAYLRTLATKAECSLRRSILALETGALQAFPSVDSYFLLPWESYVAEILEKIIKLQTPKGLAECRDMVYDLLTCCIPGSVILNTLCKRVLEHPKIPLSARLITINVGAHFSHTLKQGTKEVWHIEAAMAQIMVALKRAEVQRIQGTARA